MKQLQILIITLISISCIAALAAPQYGPSNLVDPLEYVNSSYPFPVPVGIVSYGLQNIQNGTGPYQVETTEVIGYSKIISINAYNFTPPINTSAYGATVQLNAVVNITATNGRSYSYWAQDVLDLNTSNDTYSIGDNIWNMTAVNGTLSNSTLYGQGISNATFYSDFPNNTSNYTLPFYFIPAMKTFVSDGRPVIQFGYKNGSTYTWYDNVTFNISSSRSFFLITPYYQTPGVNSTDFYDSEMVVGGEGNGEISNFTNTNIQLWMGYLNGTKIQPFPYVGTFGSDTAESAQGIQSVRSGGFGLVNAGSIDYNLTYALSGVPGAISGSNSTQITVPSTTSTSVTTSTVYGTSGGYNTALPASALPVAYYLTGGAGLLLVVIILILLLHRKKPPVQIKPTS